MRHLPHPIYINATFFCRFHQRAGLSNSHTKLLARLYRAQYSMSNQLEKKTGVITSIILFMCMNSRAYSDIPEM